MQFESLFIIPDYDNSYDRVEVISIGSEPKIVNSSSDSEETLIDDFEEDIVFLKKAPLSEDDFSDDDLGSIRVNLRDDTSAYPPMNSFISIIDYFLF